MFGVLIIVTFLQITDASTSAAFMFLQRHVADRTAVTSLALHWPKEAGNLTSSQEMQGRFIFPLTASLTDDVRYYAA